MKFRIRKYFDVKYGGWQYYVQYRKWFFFWFSIYTEGPITRHRKVYNSKRDAEAFIAQRIESYNRINGRN